MSPTENSSKPYDNLQGKRKNHEENKKVKRIRFSPNIPKAKELEDLREAENLFHSSFFKMEVEELLKEVKPQITEEKLYDWIKQLESFLMNIPETSQTHIDDFNLNVQLPILKKTKTDKGKFKFVPPTNILRIGSFALNTVCSSEPIFDVAVEIPKTCWHGMDFLNERYHRKRALYLSYIAECLIKENFVKDLKYCYQNDCHLKPVLIIVPQGIKNLSISLTAYPNEDSFKLTRFVPLRNNVRSSWLLNETEDDLDAPTPYYNSTILVDMLLPKLHSYLEENITSQNIKDGIILLKIWSMQRGSISGYGKLNGFIISMFVAYLLKKQKINIYMNSYQVFRGTLLALQHENFVEGVFLTSEMNNQVPMEDFQKVYYSIFLEECGILNLLYSVTKETMIMVKHEANLGLKILDGELPNCFSLLFMKKVSALEKFDYLIHLKGPKKFRKYFKNLCKESHTLNFGENKIAAVVPKICDILTRGLHKRILILDFIKDTPSPWSIFNPPPSPNCSQVTIGLILNPEVPLSNLERGPLADDPEAIEFRKFWGEQSEMRRFQDGSIREAVYWPADTLADKRCVFSQMVKDILKRHLSTEEKNIIVTGTEVDCILHLPKHLLSPDFPPYGTGEEIHVKLLQSFNLLSKQLRSLEGLPLMISSVQGFSPAFHFAEVFPPLPMSCSPHQSVCRLSESRLKLKGNTSNVPSFIPSLKVIIGFEGSGKWPDDVEAIKRVKAAFLIKIAELVKANYSLVAVPYLTHTDIIKDGFVFRLILACHKEVFLMKQFKTPDGMSKIRETEESRQLQMTMEILPKLNSMLHGLHQQHNTFGTVCRLAKRWTSSQLKHGYIDDIAVELLVAYCYCHPEPFTHPSSPQVSFIRFLSLIVNHDWKANPLVVNLNNEMQKNEIEKICSVFSTQRSTLPAMVIVTPFDKRGSLFTKSKPNSLFLKRLIIFAEATLNVLNERLFSMKNLDVKVICRPPLDKYDVIIHLNPNVVPKLKYAVDAEQIDDLLQLEMYNENTDNIYQIVDYDPIEKYLEELKANFAEYAYFFYDVYGGDFIAVVWKKSEFTKSDFKVSHVNGRLLVDGSLVGNKDSILEDFKLLGDGIVSYITQRKSS